MPSPHPLAAPVYSFSSVKAASSSARKPAYSSKKRAISIRSAVDTSTKKLNPDSDGNGVGLLKEQSKDGSGGDEECDNDDNATATPATNSATPATNNPRPHHQLFPSKSPKPFNSYSTMSLMAPSVLRARDRLDHVAFAESRARVYVARGSMFATLDAYATSDDAAQVPIVITGQSGIGLVLA